MNTETLVGALLGTLFGFLSSFAIFRSRFTRLEVQQEGMEQRFKIEMANLQKEFTRELTHLREDAREEWRRIREDVNRACTGDVEANRRRERREVAMLETLMLIKDGMGARRRSTDVRIDDEDDTRGQ